MSVTYKQMSREHIKSVSQIEKECFSNAWSENAFYQELENPMSLTVVALNKNDNPYGQTGEKVTGFVNARIVRDEVYINNIAVSEPFRRMGYGKGLLQSLEKLVKRKNASFITLEVRESNSPAISLYTLLGYRKVGKRKNFYRDPVENAVLMTKDLF